ncbi:MAG: Maf family protein [Candidatus Gastranaerophilales bacterium]|nr:Maf family protein [Candidatus Gastranaerophilales bacterium]
MNHPKIILASSSPRRKKILEEMGLEFEIMPPDYDEVFEDNLFSYEKIEQLAYNKAKAVLNKIYLSHFTFHISLILSADTVVVLNEEILGKPQDEADAIKMLECLSGKKHSVVTSICVINTSDLQEKTLSTTSFVEFNILSDKLITDYVKKYQPLDKAGSYGIQELPEGFVKEIEGSFENIIGLCPIAVKEILSKF